MRAKIMMLAVCLAAVSVSVWAADAKQAIELEKEYGLPLEVGRYWIYNCVTENQDANGNAEVSVGEEGAKVKVKRTEAKASIEINEVTGKDNLVIATMSGDQFGMVEAPPQSLQFYWILDKNTGHFINATAEVKQRCLLGDRQALDDSAVLVLPLCINAKWGEEPPAPRTDGWYQWHVEAIESIKVPLGTYTAFRIAYRTNPDHEIVWFAPGLGIIKREYHHHGTVSNVYYELIEYGLRQK